MTNLIFIYGPPAAGKLTVANELSRKLGYRVFQNHTLVGAVASAFPYEDSLDKNKRELSEIRNRLTRKFRIEIFETAAKNGIDLITTYGGGGKRTDFFKDVDESIKKVGGQVLFVQLTPTKEALFERVTENSRKNQKIDTVEMLKTKLEEHDYYEKYAVKKHLSIDNTVLKPDEVAKIIIDYYKL